MFRNNSGCVEPVLLFPMNLLGAPYFGAGELDILLTITFATYQALKFKAGPGGSSNTMFPGMSKESMKEENMIQCIDVEDNSFHHP